MWTQATCHLSRNPYVAEITSKILASSDVLFYPSHLIPHRCLHISDRLFQSRVPRVLNAKYNSGGRRKIKIYPPASQISPQAITLPGPEKIRASCLIEPGKLIEYPDDGVRTVCDIPISGSKKSKCGNCMGYRSLAKGPEYEWISYTEVLERIKQVGSGLVNLGLQPSQKTYVGIITKTRPEFMLTMLGTCQFSMVLVPLYECSGPEIIEFIVNQAELQVVICENYKIASSIIQRREKFPLVKHIVLIEDTESIDDLKTTDLNVITFKQLEEMGKSNIREPKLPSPDDLVCLCYTSGTTGQPKGVMLSHRNILSTVAAMDAVFGEAISENGTLYAYLPCAHVYEILNETYCMMKGGGLGYYSGSTDNILEDISYLKPTVLPLVPKLMNRIYSEVKNKVGPNILKRYLLKIALQQKEKALKRGIVSKDTIWDYLIFHKVQKIMGGFAEMVFTASAPVSKEVMRFFRCASGCLVFEAYGLSEVCAATLTLMSEHDSGSVGPPLPSNHIKLVSVPELFYDSKDDVGEICIKGPNVFSGYYKNPEETLKGIDKDGWLHTGDIGKWLPNGTLAIIDRKKHIFKLSQGEYIIPEKSENIYVQSHIISQVFIDGQVEQDFPVAVVVPDKPAFLKWASNKGFADSSYEELCKNYNVRKALLEHMLKTGKRKNLGSLQQVGNVFITTEPFTPENGLLTPTMKLKRPDARKKFESAVQQMYEEGSLRKKYNL